jgi:MFS transporter, DHA2 family, methylenomycin A resistance protein
MSEPAARPASETGGRAHALIFLMALCQFVISADFSIVGVALPSIAVDLKAGPALLPWIASTSGLTLSGFLLLGGRLTDCLGQRRCLIVGTTLFAVGSLLSAASPHVLVLIGARGLQGFAAAILMPSSFSIINTLLEPGPLRHRAMGVFGMMQGASVIVGLTLGGLMVTWLGWRSVFLLNVPFLLLALVLTWRFVPPLDRAAERVEDIGGAVAICVATGLLLWSLATLGRTQLHSTPGQVTLVLAILTYTGFMLWERRTAAPLVPPWMLTRNLIGGGLGGLGMLAGVGGVSVMISLYLQTKLGFSALQSGVAMVPFALAVVAGGRITTFALARWRAKSIALAGATVEVAGLLLLAFSAPLGSYGGAVLAGSILVPLGGILSFMGVMSQATAPVLPEHQGAASAILFTCNQIGVALGVTVSLTAVSAGALAATTQSADRFSAGYLICAALATLGALAMWAGLGSGRPDQFLTLDPEDVSKGGDSCPKAA